MKNNKTPLVVVALKGESNGHLEAAGIDVIYTGVGKVNATYALTKELTLRQQSGNLPSLIISYGSAGSATFNKGKLVASFKFVQRDMDVTPLGLNLGETPFEDHPAEMIQPEFKTGLETGICGSGDNFETKTPLVKCDLVEMEAYALAKICYFENLPFMSVKYISDGADGAASTDWNENFKKGASLFVEWYDKHLNKNAEAPK